MKKFSYYIILFLFILPLSCTEEISINSSQDYTISLISGNNQFTVTDRFVPEPIQVQVTGKDGEGIPNVSIIWEETDGELKAETHTNEMGIASAYWKMDYAYGDQYLTVKALDKDGIPINGSGIVIECTARDRSYLFSASIISGNEQESKIYSPVPEEILIKLIDDENKPVKGYRVDFSSETQDWNMETQEILWANDGGGYHADTNDDGEISFKWFLGNTVGTQVLQADIYREDGTHMDGSPLLITANALDLEITATLTIGNNQSATRGTGLSQGLVVQLLDENNNPVNGYKIKWESQATDWNLLDLNGQDITVIDETIIENRTDESGYSYVRWILGSELGTQNLRANIYDSEGNHVMGSPIEFEANSYDFIPFSDPRDGSNYIAIDMGGAIWMAENLNYGSAESWCYDDNSNLCVDYGRLYTYESALNACPDGWHLPTDEEWQSLEILLGMGTQAFNYGTRSSANKLGVYEDGWSGLDFKFAGYYSPWEDGYVWNEQGEDLFGYFRTKIWTASPSPSGLPQRSISRAISSYASEGIARYSDSTHWRMSVRCVKN